MEGPERGKEPKIIRSTSDLYDDKIDLMKSEIQKERTLNNMQWGLKGGDFPVKNCSKEEKKSERLKTTTKTPGTAEGKKRQKTEARS